MSEVMQHVENTLMTTVMDGIWECEDNSSESKD